MDKKKLQFYAEIFCFTGPLRIPVIVVLLSLESYKCVTQQDSVKSFEDLKPLNRYKVQN